MANVLFSIVIPTYNRADLILKTLNSVFNQTYKNYEIIVVDNGSTDNTLEILSDFEKTKKIKIVHIPVNQERAISRNLGMSVAKGDFLTLLDSDDIMFESNLEDANKFINDNPEYLFFHNLYHLVDSEGNILHKYLFPNIRNQYRSISNGNFLSCIGVFIGKEIYSNNKFETNPIILGSEDWEFWFRIVAKYKLARINKFNNAIVQHTSRSISAYSIESIFTRKDFIIEKIKSDKELFSVYSKYIKNIDISAYLFAASVSNSAEMFDMSRKFTKIALLKNIFLIFDLKFLRIAQISIFKLKNKNKV